MFGPSCKSIADLERDILLMAEFSVAKSEDDKKQGQVPETISHYKRQMAKNKESPQGDVDEGLPDVVSGRGRGVRERVLRPGESLPSDQFYDQELKKKIRQFDDLSHKSSVSSLNIPPSKPLSSSVTSVDKISDTSAKPNSTPPMKPPRIVEPKPQDEWESKIFGKPTKTALRQNKSSENLNRRSWESTKLDSQIEEEPVESLEVPKKDDSLSIKPNHNKSPKPVKKEEKKEKDKEGMLSKLKHFRKDKNEIEAKRGNSSERIIIGGENDVVNSYNNKNNHHHVSNELLHKFEGKSREDLILLVCRLQSDLEGQKKKLKDLEDYLDDLLLRVMETTPRILQNPYVTCKFSHKKLSG